MGLGVGMGLCLGLRSCVVGHGLLFLHHTRPGNHSWFHWMLKIKKDQSKKAKMDNSKVETTLKGSLDSIPSPSTSAKIQIMGGKTMLGIVNKLLHTNFVCKSLLTIEKVC